MYKEIVASLVILVKWRLGKLPLLNSYINRVTIDGAYVYAAHQDGSLREIRSREKL